MNGHEKIKQAIVNARNADGEWGIKQLAVDEAKIKARESWKEVERVLKAVLGDRAKHGVILDGSLYRLTEEGVRCTAMEAEVIT